MKKICALLIISLSIFLIYFFNKDTKIYYVVLGDNSNDYYEKVEKQLKTKEKLEKTNTLFLESKDNITEIYNKIEKNIKKENQTIKNALIKADLVTIYLNYDNFKESDFLLIDKESEKVKKLFKKLRQNCKETIIVIGPNDDYSGSLKYLNKKFRNFANEYEIIYIKDEKNNNLTDTIINKININA